ncbi:MAG: ATP-binding protein, partial [Bacteroidota bacterium]|nr:ATP-binding protein [Bacteroidota bacterium]
DPSGNLWAGTPLAGGLNYFNRKTGIFKHFLKGKSIYSLFRDSGGVLWVGTDEGLYRTNNPANGFIRFKNPGSSLENTRIGCIQEDDRKNIWVRTPAGIYKINPLNNQTTFYAIDVPISTRVNDISLPLLTNGYKGKNGELYFGDANGYTVFSPDKLISNPNPPHVVLTDFRLKGKPVQPGTNSPLTEPLQYTKKISLRYDQNIFSFGFAGIHFSNPEHNRQLYRLENYDLEWREASAEKMAYYYNVPPGQYAFRVKAASSVGVWSEKAIPIIISPPWWYTWWAYCLYGVFFITGVYAVHRFQKQRVIAAERERARVRELEQAKEIEKAYRELKLTQAQLIQQEKMASLGELTAGIAHEIQNPLNFIANFTEVNTELLDEMKEVLQKGYTDEALVVVDNVKDNNVKITEHSKRAGNIVRGMLQHSRKDSGERQPTDINALADEYLRLAFHGMRAKDKGFSANIVTDFDNNLGKVEVVPQELGRVLLNLFNNAFYATQQKKSHLNGQYQPEVKVITNCKDGKVEIKVRDNGTGIPEKLKNKIFQPFFTTKPTGQGTGLGLSLSYDIITKVHGGEIKVESQEGDYSQFIVILPM